MNIYRRLSLLIVITLIANNISIFAQSPSSPRTKRAPGAGSTKQATQQPPVQHLDKLDMDTAYRIWSNWYLAQEQGKQLPLPTVTVTNADEKEFQRITLIWNQAQQKAALDAPRRREEVAKAAAQEASQKKDQADKDLAYRALTYWHMAMEHGLSVPQPSPKLTADNNDNDRLFQIWKEAREQTYQESVQRQANRTTNPVVQPAMPAAPAAPSLKHAQRQPQPTQTAHRNSKQPATEKQSFEDQAYHLWLDFYLAKSQDKNLPAPSVPMPPNIDTKEMYRLQNAWHEAKRMAQATLQEPINNTATIEKAHLIIPANNSTPGLNNHPQGIAGALSQTMNTISSNADATTANNNRILTELATSNNTTATTNNSKPVPITKSNSVKANADIKPTDATNSISYSYDKVGNLSSISLPNGIVSNYIYDARNRLTNVIVTKDNITLARYDYVFGPANNRLSVSELGGRTVNFSYDSLYRLTSERIAGSTNPNNNGTINYTYDQVGNRLQRDSLVAAVPEQNSTYDSNDRLSTNSYDAAGRTTQSDNRTYSYDIDGHLTDVVESTSGLNIHMVYDVDGNRISKTVGTKNNGVFVNQTTTYYLVDTNSTTGNAQVIEELQTTNGSTPSVVRRYNYGLGPAPISQTQLINGQWITSYFITDGHESVRFLADVNGNVTDSYDYDSFGNLINQIGTTPNNYLFAGEQFDPDLGFYYNRARYLNTNSGRFLTMDSFPENRFKPLSLHRYLYVSANPANLIDPSGLDGIDITNSLDFASILSTIPVLSINLARHIFSPSYQITDNAQMLEGSGWSFSDATTVYENAKNIWKMYGINIQGTVSRFTCATPSYDCARLFGAFGATGQYDSRSGQDPLAENRAADFDWGSHVIPLIPNLQKHNTLFIGFIDEGVAARTNVSGSGQFAGTAVSLVSSPSAIANQPLGEPYSKLPELGLILAHEWGHTFSLPDSNITDNLMTPGTFKFNLTSTQQEKAQNFVFGKY